MHLTYDTLFDHAESGDSVRAAKDAEFVIGAVRWSVAFLAHGGEVAAAAGCPDLGGITVFERDRGSREQTHCVARYRESLYGDCLVGCQLEALRHLCSVLGHETERAQRVVGEHPEQPDGLPQVDGLVAESPGPIA